VPTTPIVSTSRGTLRPIAGTLLAALFSTNAALSADESEEGQSIRLFSLGVRQVHWGDTDESIRYDANLHQTLDFSYNIRDKVYVKAFLSREQESDLKAVDENVNRAQRFGLTLGIGNMLVTTEEGRITGVSENTPTLAYADAGPFDGPYRSYGLFWNAEGKPHVGVMYIDYQKPTLFRYAEGGCPTVSSHCYFTDRAADQRMFLLAFRWSMLEDIFGLHKKHSDEKVAFDTGVYVDAVYGVGYGTIKPSGSAVQGVSNATGIPLMGSTVEGMAFYSIGEYGYYWNVGTRGISGGIGVGLYFRLQGIASFGSVEGLQTWDAGPTSGYDYGPFAKVLLIW
jgi:hypothetical protein